METETKKKKEEEKPSYIKTYFPTTADSILNLEEADNQKVKEIIADTKKLMHDVKSGITYAQLRKVYGLFKVDNLSFKNIQFIRPKLAYIQARLDKQEGKKFIQMLDDFIDKIDTDTSKSEKQIKNLVSFMESIVAYHKLNA